MAAGGSHLIGSNGLFSVAPEGRAQPAPIALLARRRAGRRFPFIAGDKRVLDRCIREAGVVLTAEARARLDALPDRFTDFLVDHAAMKPPASKRAA